VVEGAGETVTEDAKQEILARIRSAGAKPETASRQLDEQAPATDPVEQFVEYAMDYKANVMRCSRSGIGPAVAGALRANGSRRVVTAVDFPIELRLDGVEIVTDGGAHILTILELDAVDSVITTCAVAVAETGTIVLDAGPGQGRRAITLVPDHHLCIVEESQVVATVPEAVAAVAESVKNGQPLTWISGPSATSDIELNRVEGVHGPRKLDIILVAD
jgi:L-lactate dehydrogenase complex protein LldG